MRRALVAIVVVVGLFAAVPGLIDAPTLQAQNSAAQQQPVRYRVQVTHVKPDLVQQWRDLTRTEGLPAQKKGGLAWRHTWQDGGPFGDSSAFYIIQPVTSFAQFDQGPAITRGMSTDAYAKYQARILPTIASSRAWIDTLQPNDSIESRAATAPPLIVVQTWQTLPGKLQEFLELWRSEYLPRYRKASVRDVWVHTAAYGAPLGQVTIVRPISKYAELDQTPGLLQRGGLTPEAAGKINARRATLAAGSNQTVMRYVPELSYGTFGRATN